MNNSNKDTRDGGFATKIWYNSVRYSVTISCGNFIETDNFKAFISSVWYFKYFIYYKYIKTLLQSMRKGLIQTSMVFIYIATF